MDLTRPRPWEVATRMDLAPWSNMIGQNTLPGDYGALASRTALARSSGASAWILDTPPGAHGQQCDEPSDGHLGSTWNR